MICITLNRPYCEAHETHKSLLPPVNNGRYGRMAVGFLDPLRREGKTHAVTHILCLVDTVAGVELLNGYWIGSQPPFNLLLVKNAHNVAKLRFVWGVPDYAQHLAK